MGFIKDAKDRWDSKTPEFFEKLKKFAVSLGTSATAIWVANETMSLGIHEVIMEACKYLIAISAAMGVTSQLTKDNNP
jgi:hypothetical protein